MLPNIPSEIVKAFPPLDRALLGTMCRQIEDSMLREIAKADYGHKAEEHFAALRRIRDGYSVPQPMEWIPHEVLSLVQWTDPENTARNPTRTGERGHRIRAFACATLLWADVIGGCSDDENQKLASLVDSSMVLDYDVKAALAGFVTWRIGKLDVHSANQPFYFVALLVLCILLQKRKKLKDEVLGEVAEIAIMTEARVREAQCESGYIPRSSRWLFGLTFYDMRNDLWKSFATFIIQASDSMKSKESAKKLRNLGQLILIKKRALNPE